jgi:hypothetical protein
MATVSDSQRAELTKKIAHLIEGVLARSCHSETRQAVKYEGESTIEASFDVFGQVAAGELFANPRVASGLAELGKYVAEKRMRKALESGNWAAMNASKPRPPRGCLRAAQTPAIGRLKP